MIDIHTHTSFSPDSTAPLEEMVKHAHKMGLEYYGTSEHIDYDYIANNIDFNPTNESAYIKKALEVQKEYEGKISYLIGMEFGYCHKVNPNDYIALQNKYPLDYVISSVHLVGGQDSYFVKSFDGKTREESFKEYLQAVLGSVSVSYDFQIVGHIGYISRYAPYSDPLIHVSEFKDYLEQIFKTIISKNASVEINTSTKNNIGEHIPHIELLKFYKALGGENITFASDAHAPNRICDKYEMIVDMAKSIGFNYFDVYKNKKQIKIKL